MSTTHPCEPGTGPFPPVAPEVLAEAVEGLTGRLRKKLDAAVASCADLARPGEDGTVAVRFGEDAEVTVRPGPSGAVTRPEQATCTCLLAPRCLHRAAVLGAAPLAGPEDLPPEHGPDLAPDPAPDAPSEEPAPGTAPAPATTPGTPVTTSAGADTRPAGTTTGNTTATAVQAAVRAAPAFPSPAGLPSAPADAGTTAPTAAQSAAAGALWHVAANALAGGVPAAGAVVQAELLRAAHGARLAGLPRAEAAALRVVRGLRNTRDRRAAQRLTHLAEAFRDLLHVCGSVAAGRGGPSLTGTTRRAYREGGSLRTYGLCREPVLSATGYGGVVTHLITPDGAQHQVSDVRPGGLARARGAGSASVALGGATLDHAGLSRGGLLIVGATVSADGRLGAGRGVKATPLRGVPWTEAPAAGLFARPAARAVAARTADPDAAETLLGCDVAVVAPADDHLLVRELSPDGTVPPDAPLLRLLPGHPHPELAHTGNLRRLGERPGLRLRVLGRPDLTRAATLRALAAGPVPGAEYTLRLPDEWLGRADLGYDRIQGVHLPPAEHRPAGDPPGPAGPAPDPLAESPLWRVRGLLESGVSGGRRAVAEAARDELPAGTLGPLRRAGLTAAAELTGALAAEAGRRPRDAFGRLADAGSDTYARAWLALATHLAAAERSLVAASWAAH
ncbi:SWIM zinc finger family protein [Streptomyces lavendulocolor]|uniref:SWIM zinc finger family protein n=1 Tax=Streptomyces lavendulocolor TaxID=67316 RepID=UPI003C2FA94D